MVAAGNHGPSSYEPRDAVHTSDTHEWACAWVEHINLNSPEKKNAEIKAFLKDQVYNS